MQERGDRELIARIVKEHAPETVGELTLLAKDHSEFDEDRFLETVKEMVRDGSLGLRPAEYSIHSFLDYLFTLDLSSWFWLTIGGDALAVVLALLPTGFLPVDALRWSFGSIFLLFLPGYSCLQLLFPRLQDLRRSQRYLLSVPVSLAFLILIGLVLNYSGVGIRLFSLLESMSALTIAFAVAAAMRRNLLLES